MRGQSTPPIRRIRKPMIRCRNPRAVISTSGSSGNDWGLLAFRTKVRPAPANPLLLNDRFTPWTRRPGAAVTVWKFAVRDRLAVRHEGGALAYRVIEHSPNRAMQPRNFGIAERRGRSTRMQLCAPE